MWGREIGVLLPFNDIQELTQAAITVQVGLAVDSLFQIFTGSFVKLVRARRLNIASRACIAKVSSSGSKDTIV